MSKELELTLTGKDCGLDQRAPMCGIPYHAVDGYLNRLVSNGHKVAICEQVEDPKLAKGLVTREVIKIVTPGTNMSAQALDESKNNYIMCIVCTADKYGISIADISTGDYLVTEVENQRKLLDEITKFTPTEDYLQPVLPGERCRYRGPETAVRDQHLRPGGLVF